MNKLIFKLFYWTTLILIFAVVMLIPGCNATANVVKETSDPGSILEVHFCPRENCGNVFEGYIDSADKTVYCAIYDIDLQNLITSLSRKSKSADVKIVIDDENSKGQIKGDGLRTDDNGQLMHNKF